MSEEVTTPATPAAPSTAVSPENGADKTAAPQRPDPANGTENRLYEIVVKGTPRKYTLEQLQAKASLGEASTERFEEAARMLKQAQAHRDNLKRDPIRALLEDKDLGLTEQQVRDQFEAWYKQKYIDPEVMTKEEFELSELKRWKAEKEAHEKSQQDERARREEEQLDNHSRESLQKEIIDTLESSGLPKTRFTVARMAYWMRQNLANGYDAPMDVIVNQVRDEQRALVRKEVEGSSAAQIIEALGPEIINTLRKYDLEQLKSKFGQPANQEQTGKRESSRKEGTTMRDVDRYFNSLRRSK